MIRLVKDRGVQVTKVTGNEQGKNLCSAVRENFIPAGESLEEKMYRLARIAFSNKVLFGRDAMRPSWKSEQDSAVRIGQIDAVFQFLD